MTQAQKNTVKLRSTINATDFGLVADGVTDGTTAAVNVALVCTQLGAGSPGTVQANSTARSSFLQVEEA
jgi:hypothetical protein